MRSPGSVSGVNSSGSSAHFSGPEPLPGHLPPSEPPQPASRRAAASAIDERGPHGSGGIGIVPTAAEPSPEPGSVPVPPPGAAPLVPVESSAARAGG